VPMEISVVDKGDNETRAKKENKEGKEEERKPPKCKWTLFLNTSSRQANANMKLASFNACLRDQPSASPERG